MTLARWIVCDLTQKGLFCVSSNDRATLAARARRWRFAAKKARQECRSSFDSAFVAGSTNEHHHHPTFRYVSMFLLLHQSVTGFFSVVVPLPGLTAATHSRFGFLRLCGSIGGRNVR